jgi:hypothetical protein
MLLQADQKVALAVTFTDRAGNVLNKDAVGTLTAVSSDEGVLTVTDLGEGRFEAVTVGPLGSATVTVSNDTDVDGTPDYVGSLAFDVVEGNVFAIAVGAGTPVSRFEDAPPADEPAPIDPPVEG